MCRHSCTLSLRTVNIRLEMEIVTVNRKCAASYWKDEAASLHVSVERKHSAPKLLNE